MILHVHTHKHTHTHTHTHTTCLCVCARAQTQERVGARARSQHTHTHTHTHIDRFTVVSSPNLCSPVFFFFLFSFSFFFLVFFVSAGHRQISGRFLSRPRHRGPKFPVLPASAPHVQVLFLPFCFIYLRISSLNRGCPSIFFQISVSICCISRACPRIFVLFSYFYFLFPLSASGANVQVMYFAEYFHIVISMPYHVFVK